MLERQKRLNEVYEHLHNHFGVHTKGEFADIIKYARAYISSAMNGNERYLTDKLFTNICEAYPGVFNLDYLLNGNGQLLTIREESEKEEIEKQYNSQPIDQSSLVNAALAAKDQVIAQMELRLSEKDETIRTQRLLIQSLQQQIADLKFQQNGMSDYPFDMGVAEVPDNKGRAHV